MTTLCLTFDIDWAHDDVMRDTLALIAPYGGPATWFLTHETPLNAEIARTYEIGLHPNFNPLLEGAAESAQALLERVRALAPGARVIRSHSLTRSSRLASMFAAAGFTHESNLLVPAGAAPNMRPWRDFRGLIQVPIRWEDDVRLADPSIGDPADWIGAVDVLTVDFHPIHVFLNTVSTADYERARPHFGDISALAKLRRPEGGGGSRDRLIALLERARRDSVARVNVGMLRAEV